MYIGDGVVVEYAVVVDPDASSAPWSFDEPVPAVGVPVFDACCLVEPPPRPDIAVNDSAPAGGDASNVSNVWARREGLN